VNSEPSVAVIRLGGELEIGRREEIGNALHVSGNERAILVDLSEATYADSTTLAELLRFRRDAERENVRVAVIIANRQFARLIAYAGLSEAFAIFADRGSALTYLASGNRA